jgi:hypothetical protein
MATQNNSDSALACGETGLKTGARTAREESIIMGPQSMHETGQVPWGVTLPARHPAGRIRRSGEENEGLAPSLFFDAENGHHANGQEEQHPPDNPNVHLGGPFVEIDRRLTAVFVEAAHEA